jgi:hypothetical protein
MWSIRETKKDIKALKKVMTQKKIIFLLRHKPKSFFKNLNIAKKYYFKIVQLIKKSWPFEIRVIIGNFFVIKFFLRICEDLVNYFDFCEQIKIKTNVYCVLW